MNGTESDPATIGTHVCELNGTVRRAMPAGTIANQLAETGRALPTPGEAILETTGAWLGPVNRRVAPR